MRKARQGRRPAGALSVEVMEAKLARIEGLGRDELRALWRTMTRQNAPKALSRDLLARMLAYRVQEQTLGKLGRETCKLLDRLTRGGEGPVRHLKVGTVMVREHQGALHDVMVVPGGFCWREQTYASLSAVARAITGTSWNGPRFFGLRGGSDGDMSVEPEAVLDVRPHAPARSSVRASHEKGNAEAEHRCARQSAQCLRKQPVEPALAQPALTRHRR